MQKRRNFRSTLPRFLLPEFSVKFATAAITALCVIFLTGCIGVGIPLGGSSREELSAKLPDQLSTTLPGQMNREEVRRKKGSSPVAESRYWRFDLFEENISEIFPVVGFVIVPIGVGDQTAVYYRYTLVEYDENELIKSYATDISDHSFSTPTQAGDLMLQGTRGSPAFVKVLASVARRDAYLQDVRSASTCTAVIGTSELRLEKIRFNLDLGSPDGYLDDTDLAAASLAPGDHKLWLSELYLAFGQPFPSLDFSCQAGEILYFEIKNKQIRHHKIMPDSFANRPLLLWKYGRWYTSPEPRN